MKTDSSCEKVAEEQSMSALSWIWISRIGKTGILGGMIKLLKEDQTCELCTEYCNFCKDYCSDRTWKNQQERGQCNHQESSYSGGQWNAGTKRITAWCNLTSFGSVKPSEQMKQSVTVGMYEGEQVENRNDFVTRAEFGKQLKYSSAFLL